jgi:UV DNA damage endonuclease
MLQIIANNLEVLERMIDYNIENQIKLFRISSDLIVFGSSPVNQLQWWKTFKDKFDLIGEKIRANHIRVSMHPGQYTVLNSPNEDVVQRACVDLEYHCRVLDCMNLGKEHKLILHIGGLYNDKELAIKRFIHTYETLSQNIKDRLILENDDKLFHIQDVLQIASVVKAPVVFDNLHHKINPCIGEEDEFYWIEKCKETWGMEDGAQKMHYSEQNPDKKQGSHSETIDAEQFQKFCASLKRTDIDIMLEVKDKNLSTVKCINAVSEQSSILSLEQEWSRYKYLILEKSQNHYKRIRELLKCKDQYPVIPFYQMIDEALKRETSLGDAVNAAHHVWGYFKEVATEKEKNDFEKKLKLFEEQKQSITPVKKHLWGLTQKYNQKYLMHSYYFNDCF